MVNNTEALLNRSRTGVVLFAVKELEDQGNGRASEVLDFYETRRLDIKGDDQFIPVLNAFISEHRDSLFKDEEEICGVSTGRLTMLFPAENTVTFKYGIGENNFGAIGVTFTLVGNYLTPYYVQVHDRAGFNIPRDYLNPAAEVQSVLEYAFSFMKGDNNQVLYPEPGWKDTTLVYPLIDPRISLHPDNCDTQQHLKARDAFFGVLDMVKAAAPSTHAMIVASWNGSHNIDTDVFRLRTYDYHGDDETLTWNFVWRDIAVQWYKHPGRCLAINRLPSDDEIALMLSEIAEAIQGYEFQPEPKPREHNSANHHPDQIRLKLLLNGIAGSHYSPTPQAEGTVEELLLARREHKKQMLNDPFDHLGYIVLFDENGNPMDAGAVKSK